MSSTRKLASWTVVLGLFLLGGCQLEHNTPAREALNSTPVKTDPAMQKRQWNPSAALYVNDAVLTRPDYTPLQPIALPCIGNSVTDTVLFLGNLCYMPAGVFVQFPWTMEVNKSLSTRSSYTMMPPLPRGPEPVPTY
jgi:hypothetical protein